MEKLKGNFRKFSDCSRASISATSAHFNHGKIRDSIFFPSTLLIHSHLVSHGCVRNSRTLATKLYFDILTSFQLNHRQSAEIFWIFLGLNWVTLMMILFVFADSADVFGITWNSTAPHRSLQLLRLLTHSSAKRRVQLWNINSRKTYENCREQHENLIEISFVPFAWVKKRESKGEKC